MSASAVATAIAKPASADFMNALLPAIGAARRRAARLNLRTIMEQKSGTNRSFR